MATQYSRYYGSPPSKGMSAGDIALLALVFFGCISCIVLFAFYMVGFGSLAAQPPVCEISSYGTFIGSGDCVTPTPVPSLIEATAQSEPIQPPPTPTALGNNGANAVMVIVVTATPLPPPCVVRTDLPIYEVRSGDTVSSIARLTGSTLEEITLWSCLANPNVIDVGQQLRVRVLPVPEPAAAFVVPGMVLQSGNSFSAQSSVCNSTTVTVQFVNQSLNGVRYQWDLGDGTFSYDINPLHTYQIAPGGTTLFTVTLTVLGGNNISRSTSQTLSFNSNC
jgi:LysM repeat protein